MRKLILIAIGILTLQLLTTSLVAQRIDSITGYNSGDSVLNGRWTGQPSHAPASASNKYKGYLAIDTWAKDTSSPSIWYINGSGFGNSQGSGNVTLYFAPWSVGVMQIVSWSNTKITIRVAGSYDFTYAQNINVTVKTGSGQTVSRNENIVAVPKGRGYGQCTWEVFYQRKLAGLTPPSTAYDASRVTITGSYVPRIYDVLYWNISHTGIITSNPQVSTSSDGKKTYSFTVTERNAKWDEARSTRTSQFIVKNGTIQQGIISQAYSSLGATSYWRK